MNDWFEKLLAECGRQHDEVCEDRAKCGDRTRHIRVAYVIPALREALDSTRKVWVE